MGMGQLWLKWMGHLWLKWEGHLLLKWVGNLWLKWVGHLWLKWVGYLWQMGGAFMAQMDGGVDRFFWEICSKTLVIRGVPFLVFTWPRVLVPLNSSPMAYYRKGRTTPCLSFALRSPAFGWHILLWALTVLWIFKLLNKLEVRHKDTCSNNHNTSGML